MFFIMSSSKPLSIASGIVSSLSLALRNRMISALVGVIDTATTLPARRCSTSSRTCNLPARNIRVLGDLCRICCSDSSSFPRYSATHSSRASKHMKVDREHAISCNISTTWLSSSLRPPVVFLSFRNASTIFGGIFSRPLTSCFKRALRTVVGDCSFWEAKSK